MSHTASLKRSENNRLFRIESLLSERFGEHLRLRKDISGASLTTFGLGGIIPLLVEPSGVGQLAELLSFLKDEQISWRILGAGSNLLIPDSGVEELVIRLGREFSGSTIVSKSLSLEEFTGACEELSQYEVAIPESGEIRVLAYGGCSLMGLSRRLCQLGFSGLEFAAGIPAWLGGAVVMNAGAHGDEISQVVQRAYVVDARGEVALLENSELDFSYRSSSIESDQIVVAAELKLTAKPLEEVQEKRASCLDYRRRTQPLHLPSAGSTFKNPRSNAQQSAPAAAELIEMLGLKGHQIGGVAVSEMHSNWIVRIEENARADEVRSLISHIQERISEEHGLMLEPEVVFW